MQVFGVISGFGLQIDRQEMEGGRAKSLFPTLLGLCMIIELDHSSISL